MDDSTYTDSGRSVLYADLIALVVSGIEDRSYRALRERGLEGWVSLATLVRGEMGGCSIRRAVYILHYCLRRIDKGEGGASLEVLAEVKRIMECRKW